MSSPSLPDVADDAAAPSRDATVTLDLLAKQSSVHGIGNLNNSHQPDRDNAVAFLEENTPSTVDMNRITGLARAPFRNVTHCIFDLDGLLLDSEELYAQATRNIVEKYGKTFDWPTRITIMGMTGVERSKKLVELLDLPISWEEYYDLALEQHKQLMHTEGSYKGVFERMIREFGKQYTKELQMKVMGAPDVAGVRTVVEELELPTTEETFLREFRRRSLSVVARCDLMPGAERLVRHLHKHKIPMAVATSSTKDSFDLKTDIHRELFALFTHIVTGGTDPEVKMGKPAPDIFLVAARRFPDKPPPRDCLVFEDAPNGAQAAVSAGMQVVMVPDELVQPELCKLATLKLKSLEELKPEVFGLPPFNEE